MIRSAGILMALTSLPSPWGVGTLGAAARAFVDFLAKAGQRYWQVLPIGPTSYGDSPYQAFSSFAGSPYLIDLDDLCAEGLLKPEEYRGLDWGAEPERVEYNTLATPRGGEHAIVLADGTRAWLNAESSLTYPVRFTGGERRVEMQGEVYFEVAPDEEHPFVVESGGVDIRVLGTSFNVASREEMVVTTLVEGRVALRQGEDSLVLRPNQQAIATGKGLEVREVTARNYVLWKDGFFYFEDAPLESILDAIARWYDVEVFYVNQAVKDLPFSVKCKRYERIEEVLRRIAQTDHVKFDIRGRTIQVYEKGR